MNEAVENVCGRENDDVTLRLSRAGARLRCKDRGGANVTPGAPVPECIPGDFTVVIGDVMPGWVMEGLEEEFGKYAGVAEAVSGFLSWMHWVEVEVQGFDDLLEGLARLKGALMAVGASGVGKW